MIEKYFGPGYPPVEQIIQEIDLLMLNPNPVTHPVRPIAPNSISLFGLQIQRESKPLPKELQTFMDQATEGVIYCSFGTMLNAGHVSQHLVDVLLETFARIPYNVK